MKSQSKPFQQKLRKMHPSLEPTVKKELNKLLTSWIIFPVCHAQWVEKLVPVRKKNGYIQLCVDFQNLNRSLEKDDYTIPPMEQILQKVSGARNVVFTRRFLWVQTGLSFSYRSVENHF